MNDTLRRLRNQSPAESLGLPAGNGLMKPFLQAAAATAILFVLLTVIPYFVDTPKPVEAKGTPPTVEKQEPAEAPKPPPTATAGPEAKAPTLSPKGKADVLDKLGENGTKTAPAKVNPLDKKDDDILKDIK